MTAKCFDRNHSQLLSAQQMRKSRSILRIHKTVYRKGVGSVRRVLNNMSPFDTMMFSCPKTAATAAANAVTNEEEESLFSAIPTQYLHLHRHLHDQLCGWSRQDIDSRTGVAAVQPPLSVFVGRANVNERVFAASLIVFIHYQQFDPRIVCVAVLYMKRLQEMAQVPIDHTTMWRMLLACTLLAWKFCDDRAISNAQFAQCIGMEVADIHKLEFTTLQLLDYQLSFDEQHLYLTPF